MSEPLWTYRRDNPARPWHIFEGADEPDALGQRAVQPLCGTLSPSVWNADVSPERPTLPAFICSRCDWELRSRAGGT